MNVPITGIIYKMARLATINKLYRCYMGVINLPNNFLAENFKCNYALCPTTSSSMQCYTNNECLWVQWYKYFHEVKDETFHSARQSRVEWTISSFTKFCNGTNIFMRWKMKCSIQLGKGELKGAFHLSPNESICSIAQMRKHSLFVLYNLYKD